MAKKKIVYPRWNGKSWDDLRRNEFDYWYDVFRDTVKVTKNGYGLSDKEIETIAWNCAFRVVTDAH